MAELLVWTEDKLPPTDKDYGVSYHAGDVIAICPDGWEWSARERGHPQWVILKVPGVDPQDLQGLTMVRHNSATLQLELKRQRCIDPSANATVGEALSKGGVEITLASQAERADFVSAVKVKEFAGGVQVVVG